MKATEENQDTERMRNAMVTDQLVKRGITDPRVLQAMREVPRHEFVPEAERYRAYADGPLYIGHGQTISQPMIVAMMSELLRVSPGDKILEIGTGSGYQTAVLAAMGAHVWSIEVVPEHAEQAERVLLAQGFGDVHVRHGDGYHGWPEEAPFDGIILTAAPPGLPEELVRQLAPGGRLVAPVGEMFQKLYLVEKSADGEISAREISDVRFVPMVPGHTH